MNLRAQKREFILWELPYLKFSIQTDMEFDKVHLGRLRVDFLGNPNARFVYLMDNCDC